MDKHKVSFQNAFSGIKTALTTQINLRIHFIFVVGVSLLGLALGASLIEHLILILTYALVIIAETINTALEFACNAITKDYNADIKKAKDVSAGAVLIAAIFAIIIGLIIFVPKIQQQITTSYY